MPEPVEEKHLSWSQLRTLSDCGVKYELTYVQQVPRAPQGPLIAGRAIHAAIEWAETRETDKFPDYAPIDDLIQQPPSMQALFPRLLGETFVRLFDENVEEEGGTDVIRWGGRKFVNTSVEYPRFIRHLGNFIPGEWKPYHFGKQIDPETAAYLNQLGAQDDIPRIVKILNTGSEDDRWWRKMGPVFLRRYCDFRVQDESSGMKLWDSHVERRITARLASGTNLTGFVDAAMVVTADGEVRIRDYKSGRPGGGSPMQLAIYAWLIGEATDIHPTSGEFVYLRADSPAKMIQCIDGERFARLVALVPDVMARHEAQAAAGVYPYAPSNYCQSCNVKAFCAYGRELHDE